MTQLFQLRKELSVPPGTEDSVVSVDEGSGQTEFSNELILTENGKYKVSRLAPSLSFLPTNVELSCYVDAQSGYALCSDADNVYVWPFQSSETHPNFIRIPLHEESYESWSQAPLCCFTWPSVLELDLKASPGLFLVNVKSGEIQFYEDVDTISHVASLITQTKYHKANLKLKEGEIVESVVNAEPAGILLSTNYGRLEFCTIRDGNGKPLVSLKQTIIKCQAGLFSSMSPSKKIIALKLEEISGKGERVVSVLTHGGQFQVWNLSSTGNSYKRIDINISHELSNSVLEHFPFATSKLTLLDSHPLPGFNAHTVLSCIVENKETNYLLSTIIVDESTNSFAIFSTYRLNTYTRALSSDFSPKLVIPAAYNDEKLAITSVFVLFADSTVLTQTSSKLDSNYAFKRKWEDIIRFNKDIRILGFGYDSNALYITDGDRGTMKLETFERYEKSNFQEIRFIKSHVDQYVYFGQQSTELLVDFNLPENLELQQQEIETDIQLSSDEIKYSISSHIPPVTSNVSQHLKIRTDLYERLLEFVAHNFLTQISSQFKLDLIADFEILNCAKKLYSLLPECPFSIQKAWSTVLSENHFDENSEFVTDGLSKLPEIFGSFTKSLNELMKSTQDIKLKAHIVSLMNDTIYYAVLEEGENNYRYGVFQMDPQDASKNIPWYATNDILEVLNEMFFQLRHSSEDSTVLDENDELLLLLVKSMYYSVKQMSLWMDVNSISDPTYTDFFQENHLLWIQVLKEINRTQDSLLITDFYQDLEGIVETLKYLPSTSALSFYEDFFEKYGYEFAKPLFIHYVTEGKWDDLYAIFNENHPEYLQRFFEDYPQYDKVKWIGEIYSNRFTQATETLLKISTGTKALGVDLKQRQLQLSIAKLAALASELASKEELYTIQTELDIIDGQSLLSQQIKESDFNGIFNELETYHALFKVLTNALKRNESLSVPHMIELFTLLNSETCFGYALSILSIDTMLPTEARKYCEYQIWRRSLLQGAVAFKETLKLFFQQKLYANNIGLPILDVLKNENIISETYLDGVYHNLVDLKKLAADVRQELQLLSQSNITTTVVQSLIAEANEETGSSCGINYETNTVETETTPY